MHTQVYVRTQSPGRLTVRQLHELARRIPNALMGMTQGFLWWITQAVVAFTHSKVNHNAWLFTYLQLCRKARSATCSPKAQRFTIELYQQPFQSSLFLKTRTFPTSKSVILALWSAFKILQ